MIEYQINIREESFGATILNLKNGQREYLNTSELKKLLEFGIFPNNSCITKDDKNLNIKYIKNFNKKIILVLQILLIFKLHMNVI